MVRYARFRTSEGIIHKMHKVPRKPVHFQSVSPEKCTTVDLITYVIHY